MLAFPAWVRHRRRALNLTREAFAAAAHCSVVMLRRIEDGTRRPSVDMAASLARACQLPPEQTAEFVAFARAADALRAADAFSPHAPVLPAFVPAPHSATPLIGRDAALAELNTLLAAPQTRLLTLTGVGGVGKTRLAQALAHAQPAAAWADLAALREPELVMPAIARAMGAGAAHDAGLPREIARRAGDQRVLLVLDTCEHLRASVAAAVDAIPQAPSRIIIVATSRVPLHDPREQVWPVPALAAPADAVPAASPAVALFVARARAADPAFALSDANAADIARVCRRLDGLPLAIELAAARVRTFSARQLAERLDDRLRWLASSATDVPERQRTLRGLVEWSHALLDEEARALFARLSVFAGDWPEVLATRVCGATARAMAQLREHALVLDGAAGRARMLETIHAFAAERLASCGDEGGLRDRHLAEMLALATEAASRMFRADETAWQKRLRPEQGNLRAALAHGWARASAAPESPQAVVPFVRLAGRLWNQWNADNAMPEAALWLSRAASLARDGDDAREPALWAPIWSGIGTLDWRQGRYAGALDMHQRAGALYARAGDAFGVALASFNVSVQHFWRGHFDAAEEANARALKLAEQAGEPLLAAFVINLTGLVALERDRLAEAEACFSRVARMHEATDTAVCGYAINNLGDLACVRGEWARALAHYRDAARLAHAIERADLVLGTATGEALALARLGNTDAADALAARRLAEATQMGDRQRMVELLQVQALVALARAQPERAWALLARADAMQSEDGAAPARQFAAAVAQARSALQA